MDIEQAIRARHSVRAYLNVELPDDVVNELRVAVDQCNAEGGLNMQLVINEPNAFGKSIMAHYGKFQNVSNYLCLVAMKASDAEERLGYCGEKIVLKAQELGLNSCWVGLSYKASAAACQITMGEKLYAVIALGYGATSGVQSKSKMPKQVCNDIDEMPAWFVRGVEWALLAPTAINQQKFTFALNPDGSVNAKKGMGFFSKMDLGIVKLHFELGAAPHKVTWR